MIKKLIEYSQKMQAQGTGSERHKKTLVFMGYKPDETNFRLMSAGYRFDFIKPENINNVNQETGQTALCEAFCTGPYDGGPNVEAVMNLITMGADPNVITEGSSPIHYAIDIGQLVDLMLGAGVRINDSQFLNFIYGPPIAHAMFLTTSPSASKHAQSSIKMLLDAGAELDVLYPQEKCHISCFVDYITNRDLRENIIYKMRALGITDFRKYDDIRREISTESFEKLKKDIAQRAVDRNKERGTITKAASSLDTKECTEKNVENRKC